MIDSGSFVVLEYDPVTPYKVVDIIDTMAGQYAVLTDQSDVLVDMVKVKDLTEVDVKIRTVEQWWIVI